MLRERLTYANVTATLGLFIALSMGTAWAANGLTKNEVKSKHIKNRGVKTQDLANNAVTSPKVANGSLLRKDFHRKALSGLAGVPGVPGPKGEQGPQGSPDTGPQILSKLAPIDGSGSGLDADQVDGTNIVMFDLAYSGSGETDLVSGGGLDLSVRCESTPRLRAHTDANGASFFSTSTPTDVNDTVFAVGQPIWNTNTTLTPLRDGLGGGDDANQSLFEFQYRAANGTLANGSFSIQRDGANCRANGVLMTG